MQLETLGTAFRRTVIVAGTLALAGCASSTYLYDGGPGVVYRGSAGYPPYYYGYPGYDGYPVYYAPPGQYRYAPYPPRVVYYDHDHRGDDCRHESHRHGEQRGDPRRQDQGRHDRDRHDGDGRDRKRPDDRQEHRSAEGPRTPPPDVQQPPPAQQARGTRMPRVKQPKEAVTTPQARKEIE